MYCVSIELLKHEWKFGRTRNVVGTFHSFFKFSQTFTSVSITRVHVQGSKKNPSGRPEQVDFPFGQVTFSPSLPDGQGPRQAVRKLNF